MLNYFLLVVSIFSIFWIFGKKVFESIVLALAFAFIILYVLTFKEVNKPHQPKQEKSQVYI